MVDGNLIKLKSFKITTHLLKNTGMCHKTIRNGFLIKHPNRSTNNFELQFTRQYTNTIFKVDTHIHILVDKWANPIVRIR